MELTDLIDMVQTNRSDLNDLGCSDAAIDYYLNIVEDGYESGSYEDITIMELAEDIVLVYQYGPGEYTA